MLELANSLQSASRRIDAYRNISPRARGLSSLRVRRFSMEIADVDRLGDADKGDRIRVKTRVRPAMAAQAAIEGRFQGGRPPYG